MVDTALLSDDLLVIPAKAKRVFGLAGAGGMPLVLLVLALGSCQSTLLVIICVLRTKLIGNVASALDR